MRASDRQRVGTRGLEVTRLGLGGTAFGNMYARLDETDAEAIVQAAHAEGIRYCDTAPLYGYGLSEARLGQGLLDGGGEHSVVARSGQRAPDDSPIDRVVFDHQD